jgi:DNA-binding IclR family transcriptional regulator
MAVGSYLLTERQNPTGAQNSDELAGQLLRLIGPTGARGADVETLAAQTGFDTSVLTSVLSGLTTDGLVEDPDKRYRLTEFGAKALPLIR